MKRTYPFLANFQSCVELASEYAAVLSREYFHHHGLWRDPSPAHCATLFASLQQKHATLFRNLAQVQQHPNVTIHNGKQCPTLFVSKCLLGGADPVAYHGRPPHRVNDIASIKLRDRPLWFLTRVLPSVHVLRVVTCCPEMDLAGLPCPRAPLKLIQQGSTTDVLLHSKDTHSHAQQVELTRRVATSPLPPSALVENKPQGAVSWDGMLVKSKSPSCGSQDARRYQQLDTSTFEEGDGLFVTRCVQELLLSDSRSAKIGRMPVATEKDLRSTSCLRLEMSPTDEVTLRAVAAEEGEFIEDFLRNILKRFLFRF